LISPAYTKYNEPLFEMLQHSYCIDFFFLNSGDCSKKLISAKQFTDSKKYASFFSKKFLFLLFDLIKKRHDVIITSCISTQTLISMIASKIIRRRLILWIEEWYVPKPKSSKAFIRFSLRNTIAKLFLQNASAIVVEGSPQRRWVKNFGVTDKKVFQANISSNDHSKLKSSNLRQTMNIENAFVILYVGRIIKQKGLDVLIRAFSLIGQERKDVYLLICGSGNFQEHCEKIVKDSEIEHVTFVGWQETTSFYKTADVLVMPSRIIPEEENADGWGLVINEAMSMGKPIITTDAVGAAEDLVKNGVNGYVIKNGSVSELYLALKKVIENRELRMAMGINSRKIYEEFNDFEKMITGFKKAIEYGVL